MSAWSRKDVATTWSPSCVIASAYPRRYRARFCHGVVGAYAWFNRACACEPGANSPRGVVGAPAEGIARCRCCDACVARGIPNMVQTCAVALRARSGIATAVAGGVTAAASYAWSPDYVDVPGGNAPRRPRGVVVCCGGVVRWRYVYRYVSARVRLQGDSVAIPQRTRRNFESCDVRMGYRTCSARIRPMRNRNSDYAAVS